MAESLVITNPTLKTGDVLSFQFAGFDGATRVWVGVVGGGGAWFAVDYAGRGSGAFTIGESPGNYILEAWDEYIGYYATATFTVTAASYNPTLTCPASVVQGQVLSFSFYGFPPYASVLVSVFGGSESKYVSADAGGTGTNSFIVNDAVGSHTLQATTGTYTATTTFTITAAPIVGWQPMLSSLITSGTLTAGIPQSQGWSPMLNVLVASGQLNYSAPQSQGWAPMLNVLVASGQLNYSAPQSQGWAPMLTTLVTSSEVTAGQIISEGWHPMLSALISSGTLKVPTTPPEEGGTPSWLLPVGIIGGAAVVGIAIAQSQKGKVPLSTTKKTTKK